MIGILDQDKENVEGLACRVTALPTPSSNRSKTAYVTPLLLAGRLDSISLNRKHGNSSLSDEVLEYGSFFWDFYLILWFQKYVRFFIIFSHLKVFLEVWAKYH